MVVNLLRLSMYIGLASLVGYYNFQIHGGVSVIAGACFFVLGYLSVSTWKKPDELELAMNEELEETEESPKGPLES